MDSAKEELRKITSDIEELMLNYNIKAIGFTYLDNKIDVQILGNDDFRSDIFREGTSL